MLNKIKFRVTMAADGANLPVWLSESSQDIEVNTLSMISKFVNWKEPLNLNFYVDDERSNATTSSMVVL